MMAGPTIPHSLRHMSSLRHISRVPCTVRPHQAHPPSRSLSASVLRSPSTSSTTTSPHLQTISSRFRPATLYYPLLRRFYSSGTMVEFQKITISPGDGRTQPKKGDRVTMEYTGWLYDETKPDNKGNQFDSSVGRGDFQTPIGVARVIAGWDTGVQSMTLGEKARLIIPGHMAYGDRGFPGVIPPNATLIFDVQLKKIN